jgi:hypothetical protein
MRGAPPSCHCEELPSFVIASFSLFGHCEELRFSVIARSFKRRSNLTEKSVRAPLPERQTHPWKLKSPPRRNKLAILMMFSQRDDHESAAHPQVEGWRSELHEIIFEAETFWGKAFDCLLFACIGLSVLVVLLESISEIRLAYGRARQE